MATSSHTKPQRGSDTLFEGAPEKPPILSMTLKTKKRTIWQQFREALASLSPEKMLDKMTATRRRIKAKLDRGEKITEEEMDLINGINKEQITDLLDDFKDRAIRTTELQSSDTTEEMQFKIEVQESLLDWLGKLFSWVIEKITAIFQKLKENIEAL